MTALPFSPVVRGRIDVDDEVRSGQRESAKRSARRPDVLADRDADGRTGHAQQQLAAARLEVAQLIEYPVVGEALLAIGVDPLAVVQHCGRVEEIDVAIDE